MKFLIDEDLPRSSANVLRDAGFEVLDVRDIGLKGTQDKIILDHAINTETTVITADIGFASIAYLIERQHYGLILLRVPNELSIEQLNQLLLNALRNLEEIDIVNNIVVIEPKKIRIKKKSL